MSHSTSVKLLLERLAEFHPENLPVPRSLSLYSAAIAMADNDALEAASKKVLELGGDFGALKEILLQSYLFLGFPRMLIAAENLKNLFPDRIKMGDAAPIDSAEFEKWFDRGLALCNQVYGGNFEKLKTKINSFCPEIFRWMISEGYGKVLSRPELDVRVREMAIVSCLMVESHPRQLHSHIRGALNVGVCAEHLKLVIDDIGRAAGEGYPAALAMLGEAETGA